MEDLNKLLLQLNMLLFQQVASLTVALDSPQQEFDAQTIFITKLNQTIQELKEQNNKNSRNGSRPPSSDGFKKPIPKSLQKPFGKKAGGFMILPRACTPIWISAQSVDLPG